MNEHGRITDLVVKHARDAFRGQGPASAEWKALDFTAAPDYARAVEEYDRLLEVLQTTGSRIRMLPEGEDAGLDSIFVRDASVVCERGVILCSMGKDARATEPAAQGTAFREWGVPVVGEIRRPGCLEGGDVVWLDARTVAVGRGYRTNDEGIRQFRELLGDAIDELIVVPLPHWRGRNDVFHLMSILSPVDHDLAVGYSPLMPVPFREYLCDRGIQFVEVPDAEFGSMGTNVLALAPRHCLMLAGNPRTQAALEAAGVDVVVYAGEEISRKGGGGPTCLTRPLARNS